MHIFLKYLCCIGGSTTLAASALAQAPTVQTAATPPATQAAAEGSKPPVLPAWRSSFSDYRPHDAQALESWREANERVHAIGGWRAYAREIQQSAPPEQPAHTHTGEKP